MPAETPADLSPLLHTAKQVKRALPTVCPSPTFRSGLDGELQQVARRLALQRGTAPRVIIEQDAPAASAYRVALIVAASGMAGGALGVLLWRLIRRR